jgi:hypothetical protein
MDKKFIVEIRGNGFTLTQQGSGDEAAARDYLSELYQGCEIRVRSTGGPVDIESGP